MSRFLELSDEALRKRTQEQLDKVQSLAFKEQAENDLYFFCEHVLGYQDLNTELHGRMCEKLTDTTGCPQKLILVPRGHLKSSVATVGFPLWLLVNDPNRTIGMFNFSERLIQAFLRNIRQNLEANRVFLKFWSKIVPEPNKREIWNQREVQVIRAVQQPAPSIQALSIMENTAGTHHDIHIYDDLVCKESVYTADAIQRLHERFVDTGAILNPPNKRDPFCGARRMIGTRWHWGDEYQKIIDDQAEDWDITIRECIEKGEVIFPEKFTKELLAQKRREMGSWHFSSQYHNNPVDDEHAPFPPKLIKRWDGDAKKAFQRTMAQLFITIDPAWGTESGNDYWGIIVGAMTPDSHAWICDAHQVSMKPDQATDLIVRLVLKWEPMAIGMEATGGQAYILKLLRDKLARVTPRPHCQIYGLSHENVQKEVRILRMQPRFERREVHLHDDCRDLYSQLVRFPRDVHRDLVDALEMWFRVAKRPRWAQDIEAEQPRGSGLWTLKRELKRFEQQETQRLGGGSASYARAPRRTT